MRKGFTLIEIMIVVAIIGIIGTLVFTNIVKHNNRDTTISRPRTVEHPRQIATPIATPVETWSQRVELPTGVSDADKFSKIQEVMTQNHIEFDNVEKITINENSALIFLKKRLDF